MSSAPKIPKEQRSFADDGAASVDEAPVSDRSDPETVVQSRQLGDADAHLGQQGHYGNLRQNLTNHWRVQDR